MIKCLCWNVRGLNQWEKQVEVKQLIERQQIGLVALLETRIKAAQQGVFFQRLFSNWCFTSNISMHSGGRIIIAWNPGVFQVYRIMMDSQFIHMRICLAEKQWHFNASVV